MPETLLDTRGFASCPTCKQYSHSIGEDRLAAAFMHFEAMFSHRGDGIPTQYVFDQGTRDAAQVLMAAARSASLQPSVSEMSDELVERKAKALWFDFVDQHGYPNGLPTWDELPESRAGLVDVQTKAFMRSLAIAALSPEGEP